jgi:NAD(P)-dependent dehydrogenase (short-subunit alcohol dehydrogenase family)
MARLAGHIALVTGGTSGIGRAIALRLAGEGAAVAIIASSPGSERSTVGDEIRAQGGRAFTGRADVSRRAQVERVVGEIREQLGPIDILVNNAGAFDFEYENIWSVREETWDRLHGVNLKGQFLCCAAVLPNMVEKAWGRIINISSTSGVTGGTSGAHYAASKGGVIAFSKGLASEVAGHGITVNVVAPGKTNTGMFRRATGEANIDGVIDQIPVGRLGKPADIAAAVGYFASEEAGFVTGQLLVVSGGY